MTKTPKLKFFRRQPVEVDEIEHADHEGVKRQLDILQNKVSEHGRRLKAIEIELGIFKPTITGDTHGPLAK